MCFGPTASFTTAAVLVPVGIGCLRWAKEERSGYAVLAAFPLLFGVQQTLEGMLWLSLGGDAAVDARAMALGYLFFAYFLWPALVPAAAWRAEPGGWRRSLFLGVTLLGLAFGASLYVPLLFDADWLRMRLERGSILYEPRLVHDPYLSRSAVRAVYALLVATPLVLSGDRHIRTFGALVLLSVVASAIAFEYAFVSIWCFFAAVLSLYIVWMLRRGLGGSTGGDAVHAVPWRARR